MRDFELALKAAGDPTRTRILKHAKALLEKGAALGTVLAFMMSVIALSLPEVMILRKVLRPALIGAFIGAMALGIMVVGYLFNLLI